MIILDKLGSQVTAWHDSSLEVAGGPPVAAAAADQFSEQPLWHWIASNHHFNSSLWTEEDLARRLKVSDSEITANKRAIDRFNQARNDATERIDEILLVELGLVEIGSAKTDTPVSLVAASASLNSETAGSIIDRMSIMALKVHAMRQQTLRHDVEAGHRQSSQVKLQRLLQQRADLADCLDRLISDCRQGLAYFKVYRQFKMYNDPLFNPAMVAESRQAR